ncbi:NAD-dependent epimerase/dehydratase family protein, partial [Thermodesulfobacteriota bacterium]
VLIFRPHNIYGPDMGWEHVIPQFIKRASDLIADQKNGEILFKIQGDGSQTRAFCYIDDFVAGVLCILERGTHLEIYHIGNPEEITIREVANKVIACFGRKADIIPGEYVEGGTQRRCPDISKMEAIGYSPGVDFDSGLKMTIDWYRNHI